MVAMHVEFRNTGVINYSKYANANYLQSIIKICADWLY